MDFVYKTFGEYAFAINEDYESGDLVSASQSYLKLQKQLSGIITFEVQFNILQQSLLCTLISRDNHANKKLYGMESLALSCDTLSAFDVLKVE